MDVNPGALLLLVGGLVAVIVGIRGTQNAAGSLITGRTSSGGALPAPPAQGAANSPFNAGSSPTGSTYSVGVGGASRLS